MRVLNGHSVFMMAIMLFVFSGGGYANECRTYVTEICGTGGNVEFTKTDLIDANKVNDAKSSDTIESDAIESDAIENESDASDSATTTSVESRDSAATESGNEPDTDETGNSTDSSSAATSAVNVEELRTGGTTDRLKYVANKLKLDTFFQIFRKWIDLLTFLVAGLAAWFASRAWKAASNVSTIAEDAITLQRQPYLRFSDAQTRWGSEHFADWPAIQTLIRLRNIGGDTAFDLSQIDYSRFDGELIIDVDDSSTNIPFSGAMKDFKVFGEDGKAVTSIVPGDSFVYHAHIPLLKNGDLPADLPADVKIHYALQGEFTYRDAITDSIKTCELAVASGENSSVVLSGGKSLNGTDQRASGRLITRK